MLMFYDTLLIKLFFNENNKFNSNYWKFINRIKKQKYKNIQNYLLNRYNDLTIGSKTILKESLYRILQKVDIRPKCPICGKFTTFNPLKQTCYNNHCSRSCEMKDKKVMEKHNESCLIKYGSVNNFQKGKQTKLERYGDENYNNTDKRNNTNLKKYGYICSLQNKDIKEKTYNTNLIKYGNKIPQKNTDIRNKIKNSNINTCQIKYGINNIMQTDLAKEHQKITLIKKYGVNNISKSEFIKNNIQNINLKRNITKHKNGTFNTSKLEDESYELLKEKFNDIIRQYNSSLYPFNCDFYITSLDLYIECNYNWTHGGKPYEGTKEDNIKLNKWIEKNTNFYNNAIYTWTDLDVRKRNIVKQNNLNYIEFWNINELKKWLINL